MTSSLPTPPELNLEASRAGDLTVLAVTGELDIATAERFADAVREHLVQARPVVLDLRGLSFMDSCGVRALDDLLRGPGALTVGRELQPAVSQILELTGLTSVLPWADIPEIGRA